MSHKRRNTSAMLNFPEALFNGRPWVVYEPDDGTGNGDPDPEPDKTDSNDDTPKTAAELKAELERTREALSKANTEAKERRLKLQELEDERAEREKKRAEQEAKQLEEQKEFEELYKKEKERRSAMEQRISEMEERQRQAAIADALRAEAADLGFATPTDAAVFIDSDAYELDDDGALTNADKLVKALAEERPYLLKEPDPAPGNGRGPTPAGKGRRIDEEARKQSQQFVRRHL